MNFSFQIVFFQRRKDHVRHECQDTITIFIMEDVRNSTMAVVKEMATILKRKVNVTRPATNVGMLKYSHECATTFGMLKYCHDELVFCLMVSTATFNNISVISCRSVFLEKETTVPGENHRPVESHRYTLSHNVVHLAMVKIRNHKSVVIGTDCIGSCKSNYHTIKTTTSPSWRI